MTKEEKRRDAYYRSKYGITLADYNRMEKEQENKCGICGRLPKTVRHNIDHDHSYKKIPIVTRKFPDGGWNASAVYHGHQYGICGPQKSVCIRLVKEKLKAASCRGLLCAGRYMGCNRKLGRIDNIEWLEAALKYLKKYQGEK